jgi:DnaJ domain
MEKDYYSILGAGETASQDEIERLYKRLARRHHPDRGGDAEEMKAINEAYRVLGNAAARREYDRNVVTRRAYAGDAAARDYEGSAATRRAFDPRHQWSDDIPGSVGPPLSPPSVLLPDTVSGRLVGALFLLLAGVVFLFLVRIYYIRFMWPFLLLAAFVVILGVWKVHAVMVFARKSVAPSHPVRRFVWLQELAFWSIVCAGAYGTYLLMSAI